MQWRMGLLYFADIESLTGCRKNSKIHQMKKEDPSFSPKRQAVYNHICNRNHGGGGVK
jgi:hypothetical protein